MFGMSKDVQKRPFFDLQGGGGGGSRLKIFEKFHLDDARYIKILLLSFVHPDFSNLGEPLPSPPSRKALKITIISSFFLLLF